MPKQLKKLKSGDILFKEGETPDYAYLIENGEIEISTMQNGHSLLLGKLYSGDLLGEMAVIDDQPRTATAIARADCELVAIGKDQLVERIIKSEPIVHSLLVGLLRRYRSTLASLKGDKLAEKFDDTNIFERVSIDKIILETELKTALDRNELDVSYQPLLNVKTDEIAGYEALIRWQHPVRGNISPTEFITLAEETSLILEVGDYVIDTACTAVKSLIAHGASPGPFIAVNVSAKQISHPGLIERLVTRINAADLPEGSIKLEITEGLALVVEEVKKTIDICHRNGIKVALDDFGTGFSNLTMMHQLKFDTIKIDQAFTRRMLEDARSMILVDSIVNMSKALEADVLVEGIETEDMLDTLKTFGCQYAQGYYIGRPQKLEELLHRL